MPGGFLRECSTLAIAISDLPKQKNNTFHISASIVKRVQCAKIVKKVL